jgi:hypothetical protein
LRPLAGLLGLLADSILAGFDICPGLAYARLDLLIGLAPGLLG